MKGINLVKIKLTFSDTYLVTFFRIRGTTNKEIAKFDSIYCDQLESLFSEETGLATRF